jgi:cyclic pyranopterin phosphate synthase
MNQPRAGPLPVYLRLSVTERCNLRCRYCRPGSVSRSEIPPDPASDNELLALVRFLHGAAPIYKVRLTGGEPLMHPELEVLVAALRRALPRAILSATTNGTLLAPRAASLRRTGLDSLNVSLDSLDPRTFQRITGGGRLAAALAGIRAAREAGFSPLKLNAVLIRSVNGKALPELVRFAADQGCEIRFIELMPYGEGARLYDREYFSAGDALAVLREAFVDLGSASPTGTAVRHRFLVDRRPATVGFIRPVSQPFCTSCDRLRLDRGGRLFACLRNERGIDLLGPWRRGNGEEVRWRIRASWEGKRAPADFWPARNIVTIGG